MQLDGIMSRRVVTIEPEESSDAARQRMLEQRIRHLVVVDGDHVVGTVSARDLLVPGSSMTREESVADLMTSLDACATPEMSLSEAADAMREYGVGCLPVLDEGELVGVITATDVLDELGREGAVVRRRSRPRVEAARARTRRHDNPRRAPFAARKARPEKRTAGRTEGPDVPAHVRVLGGELDDTDRAYIRRKLGMKLGKFAEAIERVSVRIEDVNGPRGGVDQACRVKVVLSGMPSVLYESRDADLHAAIDEALAGSERAVRRQIERVRTRPTARSGQLARATRTRGADAPMRGLER